MGLFDNHKTFHQFLRFACIGVANTLIDFLLYYLLTRSVPFFHYETGAKYSANIISFFAGATFSFFANRLWTFKQASPVSMGELTRFYSTNISGVLLNSSILLVGIKLFGVHDLVGKAIATIGTVMWNFTLQKFWVFKSSKK